MSQANQQTDLHGRQEIEKLVNSFYEKVRVDSELGFIFETISGTDWDHHLPRMYDFWEQVLFRTGTYRGNPLTVHARVAGLTTMGIPQFERWLTLFYTSMDENFAGPKAEHAKNCAADMASVIYSRINNAPNPRFDLARRCASTPPAKLATTP